MSKGYDYLTVGAGLYGAVFAYEVSRRGKKVLVLDRRKHIGGNCYTECIIGTQSSTIVSYEYPFEWKPGIEPYYPINDEKNQALYARYQALRQVEPNVMFGGRRGTYRYTDRQDTIIAALEAASQEGL